MLLFFISECFCIIKWIFFCWFFLISTKCCKSPSVDFSEYKVANFGAGYPQSIVISSYYLMFLSCRISFIPSTGICREILVDRFVVASSCSFFYLIFLYKRIIFSREWLIPNFMYPNYNIYVRQKNFMNE